MDLYSVFMCFQARTAKCERRGVAFGVSASIQDVFVFLGLAKLRMTAAVDRRPLHGSLVLDLEISEYGRPRFLPSAARP